MIIKLGYVHEKWQQSGIKVPIYWKVEKVPHLLISGETGGGKTILSQFIINQLMSAHKDILIADYKAGSDWDNIVPDYGEYAGCDNIINTFYNSFVNTITKKEVAEKYLIFDEFSSFSLSKDTREFKELMAKISHIAFMGRSFGYHLIFISQQFNAKVLDTAIRDQFGIKLYMGSTISTESANMLFPNSEINKGIHLPKCCGYVSLPEREVDVIQIPYISKPQRLKELLIKKGKSYFD
ncbi:hypothetical protein LAD12857_10790 [Lacrimispora amygdalina]|uniref:FtsK domain-containing protein n=1 Tax=Lacrimispora amygdalina TaxID=253257 RepID=A0ABQ5M2G8_9FIRM